MRFQLFLLRWRIKAKYGLRRYTEQHFPRFWHWIAEWGWAALMIGALAFEQGEEYLAAVLLLECSAISLFAAVFHLGGNITIAAPHPSPSSGTGSRLCDTRV